ncbi:tetratricopeptide repeat-containing sensor histidine kinase [Flavobacterium tegetincola]|uniref:tetratricopeptide repeat-containing sensor histidine kinase n=1 Tax=Flavobacterium tegetincola TaxID=150172 RepID=UPI00041CB5B3|nr:tetratricopeptide repeat-containing sensor histidine kinase [Flavobacterium tegetincola]
MLKATTLLILTLLLINSCTEAPDSDRIKIVKKYTEQINSERNSDAAKVQYVDTLYDYLMLEKNDSLNRTQLFEVIRNYFILNRNESFLKASQKMFKLSLEKNDSLHMAKSFCYIGDYYEDQAQLDSAFKYYSKSEKFYRIMNDTIGAGKSTLYKAGILYDAGIFSESEVQITNALQYLIKTDSDRLLYESYNLMGMNLKELNNYDKSFHYFNLALEQLDVMEKNKYSTEKLIRSRATINNNIGNLYERKKDYKSAIQYYKDGLKAKEIRTNCLSLYAMLLDNLAYAKLKSGDYLNTEALFLASSKIRDSLQTKAGIVTGQIHLGQFYIETNKKAKGLSYLEQGYKNAKEIKSTYDIKNALKLLSLNDKNKSDYYTNLYIILNDSLQNVERNTRNTFARIAYETDQVEEKNESLIKQYTSTILFFSIALIFLATSFIIYRLKSKNKELTLIQEQQESNEKIYQLILQQADQNQSVRDEERNRIVLELHDGIVNRIFTTRYNLINLPSKQVQQKELLVQELLLSEAEIRKVSHDLQQNLLFENTSFQSAISLLVGTQRNDVETKFEYSIDKYIDWSAVLSSHKVHIYRIIQEAFQNVHKYAKATKCSLYIFKRGPRILLQISDNGIGFDQGNSKSGIGLKNIAQRTKNMDGTFSITSDANGTVIEVWI